MNLDAQSQARFIGDVVNLIAGPIFIVLGLVALVIAAIRRRAGGARAVFFLGIWSAIYGIQRMNDCRFFVALLPHWIQLCLPYVHALITYFTLVAVTLTFRELTLGKLRQFVSLQTFAALGIAILGLGRFVLDGDENWLVGLNNLVAAALIGTLIHKVSGELQSITCSKRL